jgi:glycosyltransferase involved in cell wall biosynthesis
MLDGSAASLARSTVAAPLRLAFVTETFPPEVNGVAGTVARLFDVLRQRGHALELVRPRQAVDSGTPGELHDQVLTAGMPVPLYAGLRMGLPASALLRRRWTARRPELVHVATEGPLGWSALRAARALGIPVSSDFRTNFHAYSRHYGLGWLQRPILATLRAFHNRAQCTMVPTEALRQRLQAQGFRNLQVLARGVDTALFDPQRRSEELRRAWGASDDTLVALYVGRLAAEKNLDALCAAYARMRLVRSALRLVVVGDGPARAQLQVRCPDAVFAGMRSGADLAAHYASGDLLLFPSMTETFGNVTPEAMASGLAVLAYDDAAAGELIESGRNGVLAPLGDQLAFTAQAMRLAADPAGLRALGRNARRTALALGWERVAEGFEANARRLVGCAPR